MLGEGIEQLYVFVVFAVLGVGLCSVYIFGTGLFRSRLAATIFDCIWGAFSLWLTWWVNLSVNNGQCRLFIFIALAIGAVVAYITCRRILDKAAKLLYNLFTTKLVDKSDGKNLSQENNLDTVRNGDIGSADTRLHSAGISDAAVLPQRAGKRVKRNDSTSRPRRRRSKRNARRQR